MSDQKLVDRIAAVQGLRPDTAQRVADAYPSADALSDATQDELTQIKGIGAVTAARIVEAFARDDAPAATVTSIDSRPAPSPTAVDADSPISQLKVAARIVTTVPFAVMGTIQEHLPEVKQSVGKAAGAVVELGREVTRAVFRRAS